MRDANDPIRVLHVDDDPEMGDIVAEFLQREIDAVDVTAVEAPREGLAYLREYDVDCVVSDYEMPDTNGIEFLESVRERDPDLPFLLFTGKGSEEIASDAIAAGVTDYLQKGTGRDRYAVLANRIENAVESYRSNRQLENRTRKLETLISNLPGMVYRCRNEPGWPMEEVEGDVEHLTGYTAEELESDDVVWGEDILHPEDRESMWAAVQESIESGESFEVTYRIVTKDGTTKWMWERGRDVASPSNEAVHILEGFITDITDRKLRERDLREERDRLSTLFENLPNPVVHTKRPEDRPLLANANSAFEEQFGYDSDEVVGENLDDLIVPPDRRDEAEKINRRVGEEGEIRAVEVERETVDGVKTFRLDVLHRTNTAGVREGYAIYTDITDTKRYQRELEESQALLEALSTAYPDYTFIYSETGEYLDVITGWQGGPELYEREELIEMTIDDVLEAEHAGRVLETIEQSLESGELQTVEYPVETPAGAYWYEGQVVPLPDGYQGEPAVVFAARDITSRKERERELERQNERLDEFAGIVSHDLRNPLQVADGHLELAREACSSHELDEAVSHLESVSDLHERMDDLVDDLLRLAREGTTVDELEPLSLSDLAHSCWDEVAADNATLEIDTDLTINADRRRSRQLLTNLYRNALEHGGAGVVITVGELDDASGFYVADDGPGIPPERREAVFESGYSTSSDGTGFGLAIVRQIVEAHGWHISIEASDAGGARFEISGVDTDSD